MEIPDIQKLINSTTIVKVDDKVSRCTIFGDEYVFDRFQENQGQQIILGNFEDNWKNKWKSFTNNWNKERQNYRFLSDSFKLFYFSFEQLRFNKVACINETFGDSLKMYHFNELIGVSLYGMYHHGKKCIDLLKTLQLIDDQHPEQNFVRRFSETRNKLIEHNYNPKDLKTKKYLKLQIDPSIWSLAGTNSLLEIHIHTPDTERAFDAYIDYYEDYYRLEKIITAIIKKF